MHAAASRFDGPPTLGSTLGWNAAWMLLDAMGRELAANREGTLGTPRASQVLTAQQFEGLTRAATAPMEFPPSSGLTNSYDIAILRSVRLTTDPDVAAWLGTRPATEWDAGNSSKSEAKHGFSIADVDSLLDAPVLFAGRIVEPAHEEPRYLLLGVTTDGRSAALVFARRGEKLRPISCRAMRKKEKEEYDAAT